MSCCLLILDEELQLLTVRQLRPLPELLGPLQWFISSPRRLPVLSHRGYDYIYIQRDGLYFLSLSYGVETVVPMTVFAYLGQLYQLFKKYLGERLNRQLIMDNFHLVYELMDESIDMGIPQLTDHNIIRDYVKVQVVRRAEDGEKHAGKHKAKRDKAGKEEEEADPGAADEHFMNSYIAKTTTSAISWRPRGIYYSKNEFFLDVVEELEYLMDFERAQVRLNQVHGAINCRSYLSGMPQLTVGLNKMVAQDRDFTSQVHFHQCVDLERLATDRHITFVPPDGEFQLCHYKLARGANEQPLIKLEECRAAVKPRRRPADADRLVLTVSISTNFKLQDATSVLKVRVPLARVFEQWKVDLSFPPRFKCDAGCVMFNITDDYLLWDIGKAKGSHGDRRFTMQSQFHLYDEAYYSRRRAQLSTSMDPLPAHPGQQLEALYNQTHASAPTHASALLRVDFEVPYHTISGLKVEFLKILEPQLQYQSFPWIRYKSTNHQLCAFQL
ncbi:ABR047Wp [Eremothecium gossypii ATCC 10895]|uniref:ABR047Wp n=1 Tax=Eremothecium gossypii (strain ATCC 10895 / CBS 109.51 / FGSC 9923 / NRRL Y-1056) TaxID=284811 RepID=Q75DH8_EREGS|nr:ABR047Wp [Eremothecium gossypii ATCC 10895]AAS50817.1 ABR047Wp [Eremothecium gossypii ATCC 10895]